MIRRILQFSVICGLLASPVCFAATLPSAPANVHEAEYFVATSGRLMLADNNDQDRAKEAKDMKKEKEELKKKQMEERKAKDEQRKKEMAERKAKDDQKKKEMTEHREREKHKGRDEHRDRDRHKERAERGDRSKPAANAAAPAAPVATPAPAAKPAAVAPAPKPVAAPQSPLVVKTYPASAVVGRGATLNAYSSFSGKSVRLWFEWGNSPSFGQATASQTFTGEKSISQAMNVPAGRGKKYYYRAVAESSGQLVYGETMTFVTP